MLSGTVRFWLSLVVFLGAVGAGLYFLQRPADVAAAEDLLRAGSEAAGARGSEDAPQAPRPAVAKPAAVTPIQAHMSTWAAAYRQYMAPVAEALAVFEVTPAPSRAICNQLLTSTYSARSEIPKAQDPDVDGALRSALDQFAEAGSFCLQQKPGLQDTYLLLARAGVTLAESVMLERYGEAGVEGLGEPMEGGSEVGRRAVAFAEQLKQ